MNLGEQNSTLRESGPQRVQQTLHFSDPPPEQHQNLRGLGVLIDAPLASTPPMPLRRGRKLLQFLDLALQECVEQPRLCCIGGMRGTRPGIGRNC